MNLNIQIDSLSFLNKLVQPSDTIRIIITTFPEDETQAISIESKKIKETQPVFTFGISHLTKKIIAVFRKKNNFKKDYIFASTIIRSDQFPNKINDKYDSEVKVISLYEPFPSDSSHNHSLLENRGVIGRMEVRYALSGVSRSACSINKL